MTRGAGRALYPDELAPGDAPAATARGTQLAGAVDVLVDRSGRIGPLSYCVPAGLTVRRGDAVKVPFGKQHRYGLVLGPGDADKATREIAEVYGKRVSAGELDFAARIAREQFCELPTIAARLAPRDGKGAPAVDAGPCVLAELPNVPGLSTIDPSQTRRLLLCAPLVDQTAVAAIEAQRIVTTAPDGQVLILCPTVELARATLAQFQSGAARLDAEAAPGSWKGFAHGSVTVGVGTRSAALYSAERLAGIIVVAEDHPGHRERSQPYTHARDLAIARSADLVCQLVLLSSAATTRALAGKVKAHPIGTRREWPAIRIVNARDEDPTRELPAPALAGTAGRELLIVVSDAPRWACVRCGALRAADGTTAATCGRCGELAARQVNWDADRARRVAPGCTPVTADQLAPGAGRTVLLPDLDAALHRPGFHQEAWALHLVLEAARAAGPGGVVVIVTRDAGHPLYRDLQAASLLDQARRSWAVAKDHQLPPFELWVRVWCGAAKPPTTSGWPGRVLGPRKVGAEWEMVVHAPLHQRAQLERAIERLRRRGKVRIEVL